MVLEQQQQQPITTTTTSTTTTATSESKKLGNNNNNNNTSSNFNLKQKDCDTTTTTTTTGDIKRQRTSHSGSHSHIASHAANPSSHLLHSHLASATPPQQLQHRLSGATASAPPAHNQVATAAAAAAAAAATNTSGSTNSNTSNMPSEGLHPTAALQLYAAAAQLAPGGVRVPPWGPFLQFGVPGVFGPNGPFLGRPRFEASAGGHPTTAAAAAAATQMAAVNASNAFANLTGLSAAALRNVSAVQTTAVAAVASTVATIQHRLMIGNRQSLPPAGPPSEGSNEDGGE